MFKKTRKFYAYIAVIVAMFFWGISFVWTKELLNNGFNVIFIVTTRLLIAFLLLYIIFKASGKLESIKRKDVPKFLLLAFCEPFMYFIGENYGLKFVDASFAAIFIAIIPVMVPFGLRIFCKQKLHATIIIGVVISVIGIAVMSLGNGLSFNVSLKGVLLLLLAVIAAVGYSVMLDKLLSYSPVTITVVQNIIAVVYYLPLFIFVEPPQFDAMQWNPHTIFSLIMLAVFCSSIAFLGYSYSAKHISVAKAAVFTNTIPVVTIAFAVLIGQETLSLNKVIGGLIVIGGVFFSQFVLKKK
ncbi:MAG: DMT family transporter [Bacteroidales bacterium]|jgi:drug/metabolite transporter (DMT)-like permease|nr:DMT family transporter [Bacteroidales bacterium]